MQGYGVITIIVNKYGGLLTVQIDYSGDRENFILID